MHIALINETGARRALVGTEACPVLSVLRVARTRAVGTLRVRWATGLRLRSIATYATYVRVRRARLRLRLRVRLRVCALCARVVTLLGGILHKRGQRVAQLPVGHNLVHLDLRRAAQGTGGAVAVVDECLLHRVVGNRGAAARQHDGVAKERLRHRALELVRHGHRLECRFFCNLLHLGLGRHHPPDGAVVHLHARDANGCTAQASAARSRGVAVWAVLDKVAWLVAAEADIAGRRRARAA
eukprot:247319-Pleurochrysis_carterae.AAC.1